MIENVLFSIINSRGINLLNEINQFSKQIKIDKLSSFLNMLDFKINGFGRFSQDKTGSYSNFYTKDYEVIYYISGKSELSTYNTTITTEPGQIILLKPYQLYSARCIEDEKLYYYYIHFDIIPPEINDSFFELFANSAKLLTIDRDRLPNISYVFAQMLESWRKEKDGLHTLIVATLKIIFVYLFRNANNISEAFESEILDEDIEIFIKTIKYIHNYINDSIKVDNIAKEIGVSTSYLYKIFKNLLKESPSEYIQKAKLIEATKLLCFTNLTIENIADKLSFADASHLSKSFSKEFGIPPSKYKKTVSNIETRADNYKIPPVIVPDEN